MKELNTYRMYKIMDELEAELRETEREYNEKERTQLTYKVVQYYEKMYDEKTITGKTLDKIYKLYDEQEDFLNKLDEKIEDIKEAITKLKETINIIEYVNTKYC